MMDDGRSETVLEENAFYYPSADKVAEYLNRIDTMAEESKIQYTANNIEVIRNEYSWEHLVDEHEKYFQWLLEQNEK